MIILTGSFTSCAHTISIRSKTKCYSFPSHIPDHISDSTCETYSLTDNLEAIIFPFLFRDFDSKVMRSFFIEGTEMDSIVNDKGNYTYSTFIFRNKDSYLSLMVKPDSEWFYLDSCSIKGDFLNSEIHTGISNKHFLELTGEKTKVCQTLEYFLGEYSTYYRFTFENGVLKEILAYSTE